MTVPVIDERNVAINSENDDMVTVLNVALKADLVIQLIEAPGFLEDENDPESVVPRIPRSELARRTQEVAGRMKRKMMALQKLTASGSTQVVIATGARNIR